MCKLLNTHRANYPSKIITAACYRNILNHGFGGTKRQNSFLHEDIATTSRDQLTMEQMLRQCVVGHVLSNKQSFISFTATTK